MQVMRCLGVLALLAFAAAALNLNHVNLEDLTIGNAWPVLNEKVVEEEVVVAYSPHADIDRSLFAWPAEAYDGDVFYANLSCPPKMTLVEDVVKEVKQCVINFSSSIPVYSLASLMWSGMIGYYVFDGSCVHPFVQEGCSTMTSCTFAVDFLEMPPIRRLMPVFESRGSEAYTVGFSIQRQEDSPASCPPQYAAQFGLCEELEGFEGGLPSVTPFSSTILSEANGTNRVLLTIASFDYAQGAMSWHDSLKLGSSSVKPVNGGVVVVSMDLGAYVYLTNRGVSTVLVPTSIPLYPCCLRKYMIIPWRATNNIKVRAIVSVLELGVDALMLDLDVNPFPPALEFDKLLADPATDLVWTNDYSFTYSYSRPSPGVKRLWKQVLFEVSTGGWDQDQYGYWAKNMSNQLNASQMDRNYVYRPQNDFMGILKTREKDLLRPHPDYPNGPETLFVTWSPTSPCLNATEDAPRTSWPWRKSCMHALVILAVHTGRYALIPDDLGAVYDVTHVANWFPALYYSKAVTLKLIRADQASTAVNAADLVSKPDSSIQYVSVGGTGEELYALSAPLLANFPYLGNHLELFVTPKLPDRPRYRCMRWGGPVSPTNPDPTCPN